jgi:DNA glycosylase AlkZ-like
MRHIDRAERQRRLLVRHHLARPGPSVEDVADDVVGLHSSDPATVVLSARARLDQFAVADLEDALYERRTLLRMLAMRRTMFVVPLDLAAVMNAACSRALVVGEHRKLAAMLTDAGVTTDADAWIDRVDAETIAALRAAGEPVPASTLTKLVPDLALQLRMAVGKKYEGTVGVSTRVLFLLSTKGHIARGRPLGSWLSSQYRWSPMEDWVGTLPDLDERVARGELVRRWLGAYGPGTTDDLAWWSKWTKAAVTAALGDVGAVPVTTDTGDDAAAPAWALADDVDDTPADLAAPDGAPPVRLLPSLDPTIMGWKHRAWYLGPHRAALFDRNGNAGPTVWVGGRVVGAWAQREGGEVVTRLLEDVPARDARRVTAAARDLTAWMDGVRVTPRFTTPLERELAQG